MKVTDEKSRSGAGAGSISQRYGTDPRIRIRTKMSWIWNTDFFVKKKHHLRNKS
jgi:hypothetical protein